jgi:hypothetical protein|tara:strand:- start:520 stop:750 length:231 start_codon:yes stop_codon:yes gene_type:complete
MYALVVATMLSVSTEPALPVMVSSYPTLKKCRVELLVVAKELDYRLVTNPILGYAVQKETEDKTTIAFCIRNIESI